MGRPTTFLTLLFLSMPFPCLAQEAAPAQAELLCEVTALTPGKTVTLGIHFKVQKGWHLYWKNPGDSGQAPRVKWTLPPGFKAGPLLWPVPHRLPSGPLMDYGYEGEILLLVPLEVPLGLKKGSKPVLGARLDWLVCRQVCLPGSASLSLTLPVKDRRMGPAMKTRDLFTKARESLPLALPEGARVTALMGPKLLTLSMETPGDFTGASFLPAQPGLIENASDQGFKPLENGLQLTLQRSSEAAGSVPTLEGVLLTKEGKDAQKAYAISTKLYDMK